MTVGLAWFLRRMRRGQAVEPAVAVMVLAGFVKHNMPAIPLAALIWLAAYNRAKARRAAAFGVALSALGLALCVAAFGADFVSNMLMPRDASFKHVLMTLNKVQWFAPALVFWAVWAWRCRATTAPRFTALLIGLSLANGFAQAAGAGVFYNAYFAAVFASAVGVGMAGDGVGEGFAGSVGRRAWRTSLVAVLVLRLALSQNPEPYLAIASPAFRDAVRAHAHVIDSEVTRIRAIPGAVSCWPMTACYRAGKAFVYDQYWVPQFVATGAWTQEAVDRAVRERGIRFEQIDPRASVDKIRLF